MVKPSTLSFFAGKDVPSAVHHSYFVQYRYSALYTPLALHAPPLNPLAIIRYKRASNVHGKEPLVDRAGESNSVRLVTGDWYIDANIVEDYIRHGKRLSPSIQPTSRPLSLRSVSSDDSSINIAQEGASAFVGQSSSLARRSDDSEAPSDPRESKLKGRWMQPPTAKRSSLLSSPGSSLRNLINRAGSPPEERPTSPVDRQEQPGDHSSSPLSKLRKGGVVPTKPSLMHSEDEVATKLANRGLRRYRSNTAAHSVRGTASIHLAENNADEIYLSRMK